MLFFFLILIGFSAAAQIAPQPIGAWREYLPFGSAIDVTASPKVIYCATPYSLFSIDPATKEIERFSKVSGLSETGISTIKYNAVSNKLVVAYSNSNIDVLLPNGIRNIADIKRATIAGDKTINHIYFDGNLCYLSTGVGIIVLNLQKYEVKDSWFIGSNGSKTKTYMLAKDASFIYAAMAEGLKKIPVSATNPADFSAWQMVSGTNGLPAAACTGVVALQSKIIALQNDSLFVQDGTAWKLFFTNGWPVISINVSQNKLSVCQRLASGESKVTFLNEDGSVFKILQQPPLISYPKNAIINGTTFWVADQYGGLSQFTDGGSEQYKISSPEDIASGEITTYNNKVFFTAGSINSSWNYQYNRNGVYQYSDGSWTNYNSFHFLSLDTLLDFITVAIDKRDETIWAGSYGGGLVHIKKDNRFDIFKQSSPIGAAVGDPLSYRVSGLAFDRDNNLWVANFGADKYLHVLKSNGSWQSFASPSF